MLRQQEILHITEQLLALYSEVIVFADEHQTRDIMAQYYTSMGLGGGVGRLDTSPYSRVAPGGPAFRT